MSGRWVQDCKRIMDQIKKLEDVEEGDRLDVVRAIRFTLYALQRSVAGWAGWISNPDIMASFSLEELQEMNKNLTKLSLSFIEYDCEITSFAQKDSTIGEPETLDETRKRAEEKLRSFYIK